MLPGCYYSVPLFQECVTWLLLRMQCGTHGGCDASIVPLSIFGTVLSAQTARWFSAYFSVWMHFAHQTTQYQVFSTDVCNLEHTSGLAIKKLPETSFWQSAQLTVWDLLWASTKGPVEIQLCWTHPSPLPLCLRHLNELSSSLPLLAAVQMVDVYHTLMMFQWLYSCPGCFIT